MIWLQRILLSILLLYVTFSAIVYFAQRKVLYFPPEIYHTPPAEMSEVRTASGHLGWYAPAKEGHPTVMVFHGNASSIDSNLHIFRDLQRAGYGVWSVGYPGYPGTAGKPTQASLVAAARDQYEHLSDMGVKTIVFYGTSLGSGVASQLANRHAPDLLILDAPFNSVADMARPVSQGQKLYDGYAGPKSAHILDGANHINTWLNGGGEIVLTALDKL